MYHCEFCNHYQDAEGTCTRCTRRKTHWVPTPDEIVAGTKQIQSLWTSNLEQKRRQLPLTEPMGPVIVTRPARKRMKQSNE